LREDNSPGAILGGDGEVRAMFYGNNTVIDQRGISNHTDFSTENANSLRPSNRSPDIPSSTC
jgi:hypothetical protein